MNQALRYTPLNSSRLVRFLSELQVCPAEYTTKDFGMRLGALIDFDDSIILSAAHRNLSDVHFDRNTSTSESAQQTFLNVRAELVESIVKSTTPQSATASKGKTRIRLPSLAQLPANGKSTNGTSETSGNKITDLLDFEPYHRFYSSHQREMDARLKRLRSYLRDELSGYSPELARLAALDTALDQTLSAQTRKFFSTIPKLLKQHYDDLIRDNNVVKDQDDPTQWIQKGAWLDRFYKNMQKLLLAELEVRLQPLLGLLEALIETSDEEVKEYS